MLLVAALLTSPALAGAVTGAVPYDVALGRYLVAAGVSWGLLTFAAEWIWTEHAPALVDPAQAPDGSVDPAAD
jgi:hypothetical protein